MQLRNPPIPLIYDLPHELWQFEILKKMGIKLDESQFDNIEKVIKEASDSPELAQARKEAKATAWMEIGNSGKNIADYMISTVSKLEAKVK